MGKRDARRLGLVEAALRGKITNRQGAEALGLGWRQFRRLKSRVRRLGAHGILHGNRGRASSRRIREELRNKIVALLQHSEVRLNDCHVRDLLAEESLQVSAETVRVVRRSLGIAPKRRRRPPRHHRRREREAQRGAMVLIDGSPFHWFGPDQPQHTLVGTLDDASGDPLSLCFRPAEDLHGFVTVLGDLITTHGVPCVLYGDRTGIAHRNDRHWSIEEELAGRQQPTQFGQMLEELGIRYIAAHSPEAKGRIERHWQTLQDRLTAEFALHGIKTPEAAAPFLPGFLERFRGWFGHAPRDPAGAWQPAPKHLERILSCRYPRTVGRDNTVSIPGCRIQIPPGPHHRSYHPCKVEVRELLDGRLLVLYQERVICEQPAPTGPFTLAPRRATAADRRPARKTNAHKRPRIDDRPEARLQSHPQKAPLSHVTHRRPPSKSHPWKRPYKPNLLPQTAGPPGGS